MQNALEFKKGTKLTVRRNVEGVPFVKPICILEDIIKVYQSGKDRVQYGLP